MRRIRYILASLILILLSGCSLTREQDSYMAKWMIPVNATAAYFGGVSLHEGGHAIPALALGADDVDVYVLPKKDRNGKKHLGLTTYSAPVGRLSETDHTIILTMGPTAQFLGHIGARALLRSRKIPRSLQPTIAWFGLFNQVGYYYHVINGLARNDRTDLGRVDSWISWVMLAGGLTIDVADILSDDKPENKLLVLFGEYYYEPRQSTRKVSFMSYPIPGGGFLGVGFEW